MSRVRLLLVNVPDRTEKRVDQIIGRNNRLQVVGSTLSSNDVMSDIGNSRPDIVLAGIDIQKPHNITFLNDIRERMPQLPVISLVSKSSKPASDSLPVHAKHRVYIYEVDSSEMPATQQFSTALLTTIERISPPSQPVLSGHSTCSITTKELDIMAIGASTGGPKALQLLLSALPSDLPTPVVIAQHMPSNFTRSMARQFNQNCKLCVEQAEHGDRLERGRVYIAPGGRHMKLVREDLRTVRIVLNDEQPVNFCRPSVDVLFQSVADAFGSSSLGVVLTGMGSDGLRGCEFMSRAGAYIVVQDEASSVVWGMPGLIAEAGLANEIVPIEKLSDTVLPLLCGYSGGEL